MQLCAFQKRMASNKNSQASSSSENPLSPIVLQKQQGKIDEFFIKKPNGTGEENKSGREIAGDLASPQTEDDKTIKDMLKDIMGQLKPMNEMNVKLDQILKDVTQLKVDVKKNKTDIGGLKSSLECTQRTVGDLQMDVNVLRKNASSVEQFVVKEKVLHTQIKTLEKKVTDMETYSRRENLIFYGIPEKQNEDLLEVIMCVIVDRLQIKDARQRIRIVRAHRTGKSTSRKGTIRPILVRFHYFPHAIEVFGKRACLKGDSRKEPTEGAQQLCDGRRLSGSSNGPVCSGISQDFPASIANKRFQLKQVLKLAKVLDDHATLRADKLVVKGTEYSIQECYKIKDIDIHSIGTQTKANAVLFHGRFSPFSNFYPCLFNHEGVEYQSMEQFYQHRKALHFNKGLLATQILLTDDPVEVKHLGASVYEGTWNDSTALATMTIGLRCKFQQNAVLAKLLMDTGGKQLIECNVHDDFWGNGLHIRDKKVLKGKGKNHLGQCLMKVREEL